VRRLVLLYLGQQLVDHLRGVNPHKPAKEPAPLPPANLLRCSCESLRAGRTDPDMPVRLTAVKAGDVTRDVRFAQVDKQCHEQLIPGSSPIERRTLVHGDAARP
jgi:hypothetical protein